jgi:hypothetical protein
LRLKKAFIQRRSLLVAAPLLVAAVVLWFNGRETSGKRLEEIQ